MNFGALTVPLGAAAEPFRDVIAASVADDPCEDLQSVMDDIEARRAVAWVATDERGIVGAVVTQVLDGGKARQCFIRHCAGKAIREWLPFIATIEAWARLEGCQTIEMIGRGGWERLLGWDRKAVLLRKSL